MSYIFRADKRVNIGDPTRQSDINAALENTDFLKQILDGAPIFLSGSFSNHDPTYDEVTWSNCSIYYAGTIYNIQDGTTDKKFIWFDPDVSTSEFQTDDTPPEFTFKRLLIGEVYDGVFYKAYNAGLITGQRIVAGSIVTENLAAGCITTEKLAAGAVTTNELTVRSHILNAGEFKDNDPSDGVVSWSGCVLYFNGSTYNIADGNTSPGDVFIWWDHLEPDVFQSSPYSPTDNFATNSDCEITYPMVDGSYHISRGSVQLSTDVAHSGSKSVKVTQSDDSGSMYYNLPNSADYKMGNFEAGKRYTFSVWVYIPSAGGIDGASVIFLDWNGSTWESTSSGQVTTKDQWVKLSVTRKLRDDATAICCRIDFGQNDVGSYAYFDDAYIRLAFTDDDCAIGVVWDGHFWPANKEGVTITPKHIFTPNLSAISADLGTITAGVLRSQNWGTSQGSEFDLNAGTFKLGGSASPKLEWDGSALKVRGQVVIESGSGLGNLSDADADHIDETATRKWAAESGADKTANHADDVVYYGASPPSHRPGRLWYDSEHHVLQRSDGTAWYVVSDITEYKTAAEIANLPATPSGSGLFCDGTHLGFYDGGAWKVYIGSDGTFLFKGDDYNYIDWNLSEENTLTIKGKLSADDIKTGTLTGRTVQTAASGSRIALYRHDDPDNPDTLVAYDQNGNVRMWIYPGADPQVPGIRFQDENGLLEAFYHGQGISWADKPTFTIGGGPNTGDAEVIFRSAFDPARRCNVTIKGDLEVEDILTVDGDIVVPGTVDGVDVGSHTHTGGANDAPAIDHNNLTNITANQHHNQVHALSGSDHTGDLAYSQIDAIVATSGSGSTTTISRSDHAHTGSDGSPNLDASAIGSGVLPTARGGTGTGSTYGGALLVGTTGATWAKLSPSPGKFLKSGSTSVSWSDINHSELQGLDSDDHTQYLNNARHRDVHLGEPTSPEAGDIWIIGDRINWTPDGVTAYYFDAGDGSYGSYLI